MNDRSRIYRNMKHIELIMRCIPDTSWRIISCDDVELERYEVAYSEIISNNTSVHSSISLDCGNECIIKWILDNIGDSNSVCSTAQEWIFPYFTNLAIWCKVESKYLRVLIMAQIEYIIRSGFAVIDTSNDVLYDFERGESSLLCRKQSIE